MTDATPEALIPRGAGGGAAFGAGRTSLQFLCRHTALAVTSGGHDRFRRSMLVQRASRHRRVTGGIFGALLAVPSVIIVEEDNVLINPAHPDAKRITAT